jgi:hypothetical protein
MVDEVIAKIKGKAGLRAQDPEDRRKTGKQESGARSQEKGRKAGGQRTDGGPFGYL